MRRRTRYRASMRAGRDEAGHQCRKKKELLREHPRSCEGLSLLTVYDAEKGERRVGAVCAEGNAVGAAGAEYARELAVSLWEVTGAGTRALLR